MTMTPKQRLLAAINRGVPDHIPVTTHHLMPSFLNNTMSGISEREFFDRFSMDAVRWINPFREMPGQVYVHPEGYTYSDNWRVTAEIVPGHEYKTTRYNILTPSGTLTLVVQQMNIPNGSLSIPSRRKRISICSLPTPMKPDNVFIDARLTFYIAQGNNDHGHHRTLFRT